MNFDLKVYCDMSKPKNKFNELHRRYYTLSVDRPERQTKIKISESSNQFHEYDKGESFITYESEETPRSRHSISPKSAYDENNNEGEFNTRASFVINVKDRPQLEYESSSESSFASEKSSSSM